LSELGTIEQILKNSGRIPEENWRSIKNQSAAGRQSLWKTAVALGYVSEIEVLKAIAEKFNLHLYDKGDLPESSFDLKRHNVSLGFLSENKIYPVKTSGEVVEAVVNDPASIPLVEAMFVGEDKTVVASLATENLIHHAIEKRFGTGASVMESIVDRVGAMDSMAGEDEEESIDSLADLASGAPVIKIVNLLISRAVETGASDIHIEPFEKILYVRYRIDGVLHGMEAPPLKMHPSIVSRVKIMARLNIAEKRLPQDGRMRSRIGGRDIDMRVSIIPTVYGESVVIRILDRGNVLVELEKLGFPENELTILNEIIKRPYGMLLVTGPTGSGKTTTLYAALQKINTPDKKIITIEDPVEYQMQGVNQIPVRPNIGLTFQNGLRSIVRQDPDVIMVGEIRDVETAEIAIQASLTGHMVFSTVHTNDSAGAITRLLDMGVEHYLISSALVGALAQRLVRILCTSCRTPYKPDRETLKMISGKSSAIDTTIYRENGCVECAHTGYRGRIGIYELLNIDDEIRNLILSKTSSHIIKEKAREKGLITLREDGWRKVREGITSVSEVIRVTTAEVI